MKWICILLLLSNKYTNVYTCYTLWRRWLVTKEITQWKNKKWRIQSANRHNSAIHFMNDFNHNNKKNIRSNLCHKNTNKEKKLKYNFQFYSHFLNLIFLHLLFVCFLLLFGRWQLTHWFKLSNVLFSFYLS